MGKRVVVGGFIVAVLLGARSGAQQAPNFSGVWSAVKDAPATIAAAPSAVFGGRFEMKHVGRRLTLLRPVRDFSVSTDFGLDGAEVRTIVPGQACFGDSGFVATATLDGQAITYRLVASLPPGGGAPTPAAITYIFRIAGPDTLEVESTIRVAGNPNPQPVASVYKRTTDPMPAALAPPNVTTTPATLADVAWIAGTWTGANGASTIEERWTPATGGSMLAVSRTVRTAGGAQTAFEFLCMAERGGSLVYTAMPNARTPATDFLLTAKDADSVTFENPAHDFPKKIRYVKRADGGLDAIISGAAGQRTATFSFKRQQ